MTDLILMSFLVIGNVIDASVELVVVVVIDDDGVEREENYVGNNSDVAKDDD